ncbi:hypothetical protein ABFS83_05G081300 [Erythranthe nasuta]
MPLQLSNPGSAPAAILPFVAFATTAGLPFVASASLPFVASATTASLPLVASVTTASLPLVASATLSIDSIKGRTTLYDWSSATKSRSLMVVLSEACTLVHQPWAFFRFLNKKLIKNMVFFHFIRQFSAALLHTELYSSRSFEI